MKCKTYTKEQLNMFYNDLIRADSFMYGIEITGKDDVYEIRQGLFRLRGFLLKFLK